MDEKKEVNIEKVKDMIAKLLSLAGNNPSPEEAKSALLKAREMMAKYKLRPADVDRKKKAKVVQKLIGINVTGKKYAWAVQLSGIIASKYCCVAYRNHTKGKMTQRIGFVGLEDDFDICSRIFLYAFDCAVSGAEEVFRENTDYLSSAQRRRNAEAYGYAYCEGIREALNKQDAECKELGLVLSVPKEVRETEIGMKKPKSYGNRGVIGMADSNAVYRGYQDGLRFDPGTKLEAKRAI